MTLERFYKAIKENFITSKKTVLKDFLNFTVSVGMKFQFLN